MPTGADTAPLPLKPPKFDIIDSKEGSDAENDDGADEDFPE